MQPSVVGPKGVLNEMASFLRPRFARVSAGIAALAVALTLGMAACSTTTESSGTGTLRLRLVDAPAAIEGLEAVTVIFSSVRIHRGAEAEEDSSGWIVLMDETLSEGERTFTLTDLVGGVSAFIGETELDAGLYTQVRIVIQSASATISGTTTDLTIPSGSQTGIKLVGGFTIDADVITELTLDFDVAESLREVPPGSGSYKMQPTIRMIQTVLSGTISGTVSPVNIDALVTAYEGGTTTVVTTTHPDTLTGTYVLQALLEGVYDLEVTAPGYQSALEGTLSVVAGDDNGGHDFILITSGGGG
jgi:hypothetical protein